MFGLFHVGLLIPVAAGVPMPLLNAGDLRWVGTPAFSSAAFLASVAMAALTIGYLVRRRVGERLDPGSPDAYPAESAAAHPDGAGTVGTVLLVAGILLWTYNVRQTDGWSLGSSYASFLSATSATNMPAAYLLMGFGLGSVSASARSSTRKRALLIFAAWAVLAFTLGLRGEVIIPAAGYLVVAARRRELRVRPWMGLVAVAFLAAGSAVRVVRNLGLATATLGLKDVDPFNGITELGYSIRPLVVISNFHDRLGEPFVGLETYISPFRRIIVGRILGGQVPSVSEDPAVFGSIILQRIGPIGGSPAAEAYRVGGLLALVAAMFVIGFVVACLDTQPSSTIRNVAVGLFAFILLLWVRNDFTPVPAQSLTALSVLLLVWFLDQRTRSPAPARSV